MAGINNFSLFLISSIILIISPGPDFIYVTTRGISDGNKAGILSAIGISTGLLIHTLFAAFGLSAIIQASRLAYQIVKYAGAAYLIYLGLKSILSKTENKNKKLLKKNNGNIYKQGILTNVFNPKAILTFLAFLPQFVDVSIKNPVFQFTFLGVIEAVLAVIWFSFIGYFAGRIGDLIKKSKIFQNIIKYLSSVVMLFLGLRIILQKE